MLDGVPGEVGGLVGGVVVSSIDVGPPAIVRPAIAVVSLLLRAIVGTRLSPPANKKGARRCQAGIT
jgi:hypothetical protein